MELALQYTKSSQFEIGRSAALGVSTLCGEESILMMIHVRSLVVGVVYMSMDYDSWSGPYCPQTTVTLCMIFGQRATSNQTKRPYQEFYAFISSKTRSSLELLTTKLFVQCYCVLLIFHRPDESGLLQQVATILE